MTKLARIMVALVAAITLGLLGLAVATTAQAGSTLTTPSAGDACQTEGDETQDAKTAQDLVCAENEDGELVWTVVDDPDESPTPTPTDTDDDDDDDDDDDGAPTPTPVQTEHPVTG